MFGGTNGQRCIGVHGVSNVLFESRGGGRAGWFVGLLPVVVLLLAEYNWLLSVDVGVKQRGVQGGVGHNVDGASWPVWVLCGCVGQEVEEENEVWLHGGGVPKVCKCFTASNAEITQVFRGSAPPLSPQASGSLETKSKQTNNL
jgi:hypothetical protein